MVLARACAYQNTLVIHTEDVCLNVSLTLTVRKMKLVGEISAKILVQDCVDQMRNVKQ